MPSGLLAGIGLTHLSVYGQRPAPAELRRFIDVHAAAVAPLRQRFVEVVEAGPAAWLQASIARIAALPPRDPDAVSVTRGSDRPRLGMCGLLGPLEIVRTV